MPDSLKEIPLKTGRFCWREIGTGPPLVLLHGWSMSHAVFHELAELLANDFHLLIPDLPGHGNSEPVEPCSLASISSAMLNWFEELDLGRIDLLGWSLGGQVALQICADHPQRIRRLVLMSSTPRFCAADGWPQGLPLSELRFLRRGLQSRYLATMGEFFDLQFQGEDLSPERRREILQFAVRPIGLPAPENALLTLDILGKEDQRSRLQEIEHQTLVIHGENDRIIPLSAGKYLSEHLKNAKGVFLPEIGHAPFLSAPAQSAQLIREFCQ